MKKQWRKELNFNSHKPFTLKALICKLKFFRQQMLRRLEWLKNYFRANGIGSEEKESYRKTILFLRYTRKAINSKDPFRFCFTW